MVQPGEHGQAYEPPPMRPSFEATARERRIARQQGDAFGTALAEMMTIGVGQEERAGEYTIALITLLADGFYYLQGGRLVWQEPAADENAYVLVAPRDANDGRFVPGLTVQVTLVDPQGREVGAKEQGFVWHPWLYHYGANWAVPGPGDPAGT